MITLASCGTRSSAYSSFMKIWLKTWISLDWYLNNTGYRICLARRVPMASESPVRCRLFSIFDFQRYTNVLSTPVLLRAFVKRLNCLSIFVFLGARAERAVAAADRDHHAAS